MFVEQNWDYSFLHNISFLITKKLIFVRLHIKIFVDSLKSIELNCYQQHHSIFLMNLVVKITPFLSATLTT